MFRPPCGAGILLSLVACTSTQVTPLGPVPRGVTVDLQDRFYEIGGETEEELQRQMVALGPGVNWFSYRWRIDWNYRYGEVEDPSILASASTETVCKANNLRITLSYTRTLPRWDPPEGAPEDLVRRWEGFLEAVRIHGEGHRDIAVDAVREIVRRLEDLETSNCAFLEREAERMAEGIIEQAGSRDREYDETTQHGRTQGVVWPYHYDHSWSDTPVGEETGE